MNKAWLTIVLLVGVLALSYWLWPSGLVRYQDPTYGFSFSYSKELVKGEGKVFLPGPIEEAAPAVTFTRVAKVAHQSMSGESQPTTANPKISVAVLQGSIVDIAKDFSVYDKIGQNIFQAGVEGEGVIYYLVALNAKQTLLFEQSFIDEAINPVYQNKSEFLSLADQQKYVQAILATLKIGTID